MVITNKKARFNYILFDRIEAGISLNGIEAKTLQSGRGDLSNSYAKLVGGELYLVNLNVPINIEGKNPTRSRKLLIHKGELISLQTKIKAKKLTLVPVKLYNKRSLRPGGRKSRLIKVELALAKPKRKFEKREELKKKDLEKEIATALKFRSN